MYKRSVDHPFKMKNDKTGRDVIENNSQSDSMEINACKNAKEDDKERFERFLMAQSFVLDSSDRIEYPFPSKKDTRNNNMISADVNPNHDVGMRERRLMCERIRSGSGSDELNTDGSSADRYSTDNIDQFCNKDRVDVDLKSQAIEGAYCSDIRQNNCAINSPGVVDQTSGCGLAAGLSGNLRRNGGSPGGAVFGEQNCDKPLQAISVRRSGDGLGGAAFGEQNCNKPPHSADTPQTVNALKTMNVWRNGGSLGGETSGTYYANRIGLLPEEQQQLRPNDNDGIFRDSGYTSQHNPTLASNNRLVFGQQRNNEFTNNAADQFQITTQQLVNTQHVHPASSIPSMTNDVMSDGKSSQKDSTDPNLPDATQSSENLQKEPSNIKDNTDRASEHQVESFNEEKRCNEEFIDRSRVVHHDKREAHAQSAMNARYRATNFNNDRSNDFFANQMNYNVAGKRLSENLGENEAGRVMKLESFYSAGEKVGNLDNSESQRPYSRDGDRSPLGRGIPDHRGCFRDVQNGPCDFNGTNEDKKGGFETSPYSEPTKASDFDRTRIPQDQKDGYERSPNCDQAGSVDRHGMPQPVPSAIYDHRFHYMSAASNNQALENSIDAKVHGMVDRERRFQGIFGANKQTFDRSMNAKEVSTQEHGMVDEERRFQGDFGVNNQNTDLPGNSDRQDREDSVIDRKNDSKTEYVAHLNDKSPRGLSHTPTMFQSRTNSFPHVTSTMYDPYWNTQGFNPRSSKDLMGNSDQRGNVNSSVNRDYIRPSDPYARRFNDQDCNLDSSHQTDRGRPPYAPQHPHEMLESGSPHKGSVITDPYYNRASSMKGMNEYVLKEHVIDQKEGRDTDNPYFRHSTTSNLDYNYRPDYASHGVYYPDNADMGPQSGYRPNTGYFSQDLSSSKHQIEGYLNSNQRRHSAYTTESMSSPQQKAYKAYLKELENKRKPKVRICSNCKTTSTPSWRRCGDQRQLLCNACGLYRKLHGRDRPLNRVTENRNKVRSQPKIVCNKCGSAHSKQWRCNNEGFCVCDACFEQISLEYKQRTQSKQDKGDGDYS